MAGAHSTQTLARAAAYVVARRMCVLILRGAQLSSGASSSSGGRRPSSRGNSRPDSRGSDRPDSRGSSGAERPRSRGASSEASYGMSHYDDMDAELSSSDDVSALRTDAWCLTMYAQPPSLTLALSRVCSPPSLARRQDSGSESDDEIEFQPKQVPAKPFNKRGFTMYCCFLGLFCYNTPMSGSDVYFFADFSRNLVSKDDFWRITNAEEYYEWMGTHFFPSLIEYSTEAEDLEPFRLLSVPRVRQVRGKPCSIPESMTHVTETCYEWGESTESFGAIDPNMFQYSDATETGENFHFSYSSGLYGGGGFLLPNITNYMYMELEDKDPNEFYMFPNEATPMEQLIEDGWIDGQTLAVFHDYVIYSPRTDSYCTVRLVMERSGGNVWMKHISVGVVQLHTFPHIDMIKEVAFMCFVSALVIGELVEFFSIFSDPKQLVKEDIVEHRYDIRLKCLNYAAFQGCFEYKPNQLIYQLSKRLHLKYQDDAGDGDEDSVSGDHIQRLNSIGVAVEKLHATRTRMKDAGYRKGFDLKKTKDVDAQHQAIMAVMDIFDRIKKMHVTKGKMDMLDNFGDYGFVSKLTRRQLALRLPLAMRGYFRDGWNYIDVVNYSLFFLSISLRIYGYMLVGPVIEKRESLRTAEGGLYGSGEYIKLQTVSFWFAEQQHIMAFNAILTWLKVFKFLDYHPSMSVLTVTLAKASSALVFWTAAFVIVLIGSGQGFYLAFGLDLYEYRGIGAAWLSLLRMAVGDFDYSQLEESQTFLGPLMFWIYLFLAFFVLMSMFIALISEAYDSAMEEAEQRVPIGISGRLRHFGSWYEITQEADHRINLALNSNILSKKMYLEFTPFVQAIAPFMKEYQKEFKRTKRGRRRSVENVGDAPGSRPTSQPDNPGDGGASSFAPNSTLKDPGVTTGWAGTDFEEERRCPKCARYLEKCMASLGRDPNKANKYAWLEESFESATLKNKGVRCKALQSYGETEGALPHDLHFTKEAIIIITEQPTEAGAKWRGYLETDEKKRDGNVNPMHLDSNGVPQHRERPLDLSDSDEEDDPEIDEKFRTVKKDVTESTKSLLGTNEGLGEQPGLEDLWGGIESEDKTLTHKDKDAIIKLKEKIEQRDVELDKVMNENKRLRDERNKYMSQSTSLNDRIATAHKASEEIAPWIQRDVQQALDLLRRQEEIALPAAHRHSAVIERLDKQERYIAKLLQLAARGNTNQPQQQQQQQQHPQMSPEQMQAMMMQTQQRQALAATEAGLAATRADHPTPHPQILPSSMAPHGHERSKALAVAVASSSGSAAIGAMGARMAGAGGRGPHGELEEYERQLRQLDEEDYPSP